MYHDVLNNNDITAGGNAIPILCIRVSAMVQAQKDSYKRVYKNDGKCHYPKFPKYDMNYSAG